MPFASEKQRRFMYARHPGIARRWSAEEKLGNPVPKKPSGRTKAGLYEFSLRRKKIAKLAAERRAGVEARAARGPATTQAQLTARRKATKEEPVPLTQSQKAAVLRKRIMPRTRLDELVEVLTQKPKKKRKR